MSNLALRKLNAPLLPWAAVGYLGVIWERHLPLSDEWLAIGCLGCVTFGISFLRRHQTCIGQWLFLFAFAFSISAWHRIQAYLPADSVAHFATLDGFPCQLRGTVLEGPDMIRTANPELYSLNQDARRCNMKVEAHTLVIPDKEQKISGMIYVHVNEAVRNLMPGDGVELVGLLKVPGEPMNPGAPDRANIWRDEGIQAILLVKTGGGITRQPESARWSFSAMMARSRGWIGTLLDQTIPEKQRGVARALITGEVSSLEPEQFEGYQRTGVYHVLAVSGQHLVILCVCFAWGFRFFDVTALTRFTILGGFVLLYMLFTGAHAPVVRAAIMVLLFLLAPVLGRRAKPINTLSAACLIILLLHPADMANMGCLLSFLATFVLIHTIPALYSWRQSQRSPFDRLRDELRPAWLQLILLFMRGVAWSFIGGLVVWLVIAPLVVWQYHLLSPVAILLGPVISFFASVTLLLGFLIIPLSWIGLAAPLGWLAGASLNLSDSLVMFFSQFYMGFQWLPDLPTYWLILFYVIAIPPLIVTGWFRHGKWLAAVAVIWLCGAAWLMQPKQTEELRVTVLAIGHGNTTVLETPDGRVFLVDMGSTSGPQTIVRQVSHYLWSRGRTQIDEVLVSHADLDHFNGLVALSERFRIGRISFTPTFQEKPAAGVTLTMKKLRDRRIETRIISQGQQLMAGEVLMTVLHPPADGTPAGIENARSMVLWVSYQQSSLLLTGDIEGAGLNMLMRQPARKVDVLIAPHHGSPTSNTVMFAEWCQPKLVISSESPPSGKRPDPYSPLGATLWRTGLHGAVTIHMAGDHIQSETFATKQFKKW